MLPLQRVATPCSFAHCRTLCACQPPRPGSTRATRARAEGAHGPRAARVEGRAAGGDAGRPTAVDAGDLGDQDDYDEGSGDDDGMQEGALEEGGASSDTEEWGVDIDSAQVDTGSSAWGEVALQVARDVLADTPALRGLQLYALVAVAASKRLSIRLDKLEDRFGSPSLEDVEAFSRLFVARFGEALGEALAGDIEVEVSSPGAERALRLPGDLQRFAELPMQVQFDTPEQKIDTRVLNLDSYDESAGMTVWKLANVRINRQGNKGGNLTRKQRDLRFNIALQAIRRANLYIDM